MADTISLDAVAALFPELTVLETMKAGAQADVFHVGHPAHGECVLKVIKTQFVARGEREIAALEATDSPYVIRLLEYGSRDIDGESRPYILIPFVSGVELREKLKSSGCLTEDQVRALIWDVARGLEALWSSKIVHRDVNPRNIMMADTGQAILIDLGVARCLDMDTLTLGAGGWGTAGYMSPEQGRGVHELTVKSDVFSLGVTAVEALTGNHPFGRDQYLIMGLTARPVVPTSVPASVETRNLLGRMLDPNPLLRPLPADLEP